MSQRQDRVKFEVSQRQDRVEFEMSQRQDKVEFEVFQRLTFTFLALDKYILYQYQACF